MGITTFAAIDVGSYNVCMDIYEMSPRIGIRQIEEIRQRLEIGRDTYGKGKIAFETASQLCHILKDFSHIMEGYRGRELQGLRYQYPAGGGKRLDRSGTGVSEDRYPGRDTQQF